MKYGGKFSISDGEAWAMPNGRGIYFILDPKIGCRGANIAVGSRKPGKEFALRKYPISEKTLIIHSGRGECYFYDKQVPVETGDIVLVPPGVLHSTRNPAENTEDFVTLGIATPSQFNLYLRVGYDILEDNSGGYVGEI